MKCVSLAAVFLLGMICFGALDVIGLAQSKKGEPAKKAAAIGEQEREVKEADIPAAALKTLRQQAGAAAFTAFAEEVEHGHKFYEGSFKSPAGNNVDVLVTEAGDLVEVEESIGPEKMPAVVMAAARKATGEKAELQMEKKTEVKYEVHFQKDGKGHELVLTPDGRIVEDEAAEANENKEKD